MSIKSNKFRHQSGQAVLIVLLSLSVVLIIVLYIMSRSVTDISLSSKEEDSMRAFSAAEAGIERALVIGTGGSGSFGDANFSANVSDFAKSASSVTYPISLSSGEIATFWFSRPSEPVFDGNQVKVCWGAKNTVANDSFTPAVELSVYYLESGVYKIQRVALDPNSNRAIPNHFTIPSSGSCTIGTDEFQFYNTVSLPTSVTLKYMTAKILYNSNATHKIGIDVSSTASLLPSQGVKVNADGSYSSSNRSIEVYQLYPVAPSIFMNSVFSSTGITK